MKIAIKFLMNMIMFIIVGLTAFVSFITGALAIIVEKSDIQDWRLFSSWRPWYYEYTGESLTNIHLLGYGFLAIALGGVIFLISRQSK